MVDAFRISSKVVQKVTLNWVINMYITIGSNGVNYGPSIQLPIDIRDKLSLLKVSPHNTHIKGVGFRSDYEGDDQEIEPFFYVVV